jgi:hypothetical protein
MAPKSILKKSTGETVDKDTRLREIAIHQANIIQHQKDVENQIFECLEALIDYPLSANGTAADPSASDVERFRTLITSFRSRDFDELIKERNLANKCGYVFCPQEPRVDNAKGKSRILGKSSVQNFKIVDADKIAHWCSDDCALRALHISFQLNEEPAWLRTESNSPQIVPLTGDITTASSQVPAKKHNTNVEQLRKDLEILALERGDKSSSRRPGLVSSTIIEKASVEAPNPPSTSEAYDEIAHKMVEGYQPQTGKTRELGEREWDV